MPAMIVPRESIDLIESTAVSFSAVENADVTGRKSTKSHRMGRDSPFLGAFHAEWNASGMLYPKH